VWRNRSLPVASHAAARVPIRIERRAFPSLSIPDTRERCERRARLETLTPRDNTDLALVNSGYSKTKLVAAARVCHFRSLLPIRLVACADR